MRATDEQLVRRLRDGDDAAFELVHQRYAKRLERYAAKILGGRRELAEDVVQEALIRAHRALRRDHQPLHLASWLHRLVRNCCLDELSRVRFAPLADDTDAPEALAPGPHAVLEQRDAVHGLLADIAALPSAQRHALLRRELDGLGHEELAAELGVTPQASKQLVHRARLNVIKGREARDACCLAVQGDLLAAHDERRRASAATYRHLVTCKACRGLRDRLRTARRGALALVPPAGLAVLLGALAAKLGPGGKATAGGIAVFAASATVAAPILFVAGDPSPVTVTSPALPGGALSVGAPVPPATAMVTRVITFKRGDALPQTVTLTCPEHTRIAGILPPAGARIGVGYAPGTTVGVGRDAELVFERHTADRDGSLVVGTLCRVPDTRGSVIPGEAAAEPWTRTCADHAYLLAEPGGEAVGSLRTQQPLAVQSIERGWRACEDRHRRARLGRR
ncbi:RNA polymerase sigma factor [Solirubrobacter deserti]|uniref:Sigma-70 family RNA polymerase sigma factor n=1 Tax=Solirubrobacter deserti TaxID=2282478 RepID=A0ABT4RM71_9ACTN|nr:sigma-70 family RNA polymerase sigma factor [Solirubrobacter deserti]MDA0139375.1 sigma-70 family RNA polymerase sigma factor [Solirubrobacter deserti]